MLLAIDIGNTRTKAAVFEGDTLIEHFAIESDLFFSKINDIIKSHSKLKDIVVSSVVGEELALQFPNIKIHVVDRNWNFPFRNLYNSPETLGIDRMILAAGAVYNYPDKNRLVIDAGTCITYDFIDKQNNYHGGAISPGIGLRYHSLHQNTAKLPALNLTPPEDLIGRSTDQSIHTGVVNGTTNEIDGFITEYKLRYPNFIIILTGGDAVFLAKRLKNTIFANSNFLLESLNQSFQHKIPHD